MNSRISSRAFVRESLLALLVVALTFLNYGHVSAPFAGDIVTAPTSQCGSPMLPDQLGHPPCHACRIGGGADLPPAPMAIEPVAFAVAEVVYRAPAEDAGLLPRTRPAQPRGPPAFA